MKNLCLQAQNDHESEDSLYRTAGLEVKSYDLEVKTSDSAVTLEVLKLSVEWWLADDSSDFAAFLDVGSAELLAVGSAGLLAVDSAELFAVDFGFVMGFVGHSMGCCDVTGLDFGCLGWTVLAIVVGFVDFVEQDHECEKAPSLLLEVSVVDFAMGVTAVSW